MILEVFHYQMESMASLFIGMTIALVGTAILVRIDCTASH